MSLPKMHLPGFGSPEKDTPTRPGCLMNGSLLGGNSDVEHLITAKYTNIHALPSGTCISFSADIACEMSTQITSCLTICRAVEVLHGSST